MADDNRAEEQSTGVVAWLAAPPLLRRDVVCLDTLIDDMLKLLQPFSPRAICTNEPRIYRLTPLGRSLLREAIDAECVNLIMFDFGEHSIADDPVIAHIGGDTLYSGQRWIPALPTEVEISITMPDAAVCAEMAQRVTDFMQRQTATLDAAAAFVSQQGDGKHPGRSGYEYDQDLPNLA